MVDCGTRQEKSCARSVIRLHRSCWYSRNVLYADQSPNGLHGATVRLSTTNKLLRRGTPWLARRRSHHMAVGSGEDRDRRHAANPQERWTDCRELRRGGRPEIVVNQVGAARFELATSCSQSRRANQAAPRPEGPTRFRAVPIAYPTIVPAGREKRNWGERVYTYT